MRKLTVVAISAILISGCEPVDTLGTVSEIPGPRTSHKIPERFTTGVPDSGVELDMGWDSRRGEIVPNRCIQFSPIRAPGMEIEVDLSEVSDQSEIIDALNVRASVSVKSITGSGSAKASFAKKSKVKSNQTTLLLNAKIENGALFVGPPAAPAAARRAFPRVRQLPKSESWPRPAPASDAIVFDPAVKGRLKHKDSFRELCGDYFVAAIYSGTQLVSTISFKSADKSSKQTITAAIKGELGGVSASADAKKDHQTALASTSLERKFMQVGGGHGPVPVSREGLAQKLQGLAEEAAADPKFHTMELRSYREIAGAEELVYASNDADYETVTDYYWLLSSLYDDIETIREEQDSYAFDTGLPLNQLLALQDQVLDVRGGALRGDWCLSRGPAARRFTHGKGGFSLVREPGRRAGRRLSHLAELPGRCPEDRRAGGKPQYAAAVAAFAERPGRNERPDRARRAQAGGVRLVRPVAIGAPVRARSDRQ